MARSTRDLLNTLHELAERKVGFNSLRDAWADATTAHGRLMLTVLAGLAEFERELILARTSAGRKRAKGRDVKFGRPTAVPHVHAIDNGITKRSAALNHPAAPVGMDVTRRQFASTSIARNGDERLLHGKRRSSLHTFRLQSSGVGGLTACHESVNQGSKFTRSACYQRWY